MTDLRADAVLYGAPLQAAIDKALGGLRSNFRTSDGKAGWYHYLDDPNPGVTASAVGLFVFSTAGRRFEDADKIVHFLQTKQIVSDDGFCGGWAVRTAEDVPIIEATAWVVRALSLPGLRLAAVGDALRRGAEWIKRNQNSDSGWGSYLEQPSRVFTTALAMLALQECGEEQVLADAHKWLLDSQHPGAPAWGPLRGAEPTLFHTSFALLALLNQPAALNSERTKAICDWIYNKLSPAQNTERETTVEEYTIPYVDRSNKPQEFQNSLPHFACPVALTALLRAGADPYRKKIFESLNNIVASQGKSGAWELPRSPTRPSIWAVWPFISAISEAKRRVLPTEGSRAQLVFSGCSIVQTENAEQNLTRRVLVRNAVFDWARARKLAIALYLIAAIIALAAAALLLLDQLDAKEALLALIVPVLLLVFQLTWDRRRRSGP